MHLIIIKTNFQNINLLNPVTFDLSTKFFAI